MIQTLKEEEQKDEISYKLYLSLKKSGNNYSFFVKEKTVWDHIQEIVIVNDLEREVDNVPNNTQNATVINNDEKRTKVNQNPVDNASNNTENLTPPNKTKILLIQMTIMLSVFAALSITTTIILEYLKFELEVVMSFFALAILLIVIAFFLFIIQEFMTY
ncbi:MAG: DUF2721 domain-containing protein [Okeania sp. SIO3C4]|nr:DUF2721 domain-containing protein [Okeania sp. SIO3C4]